MTSNCYRSIPLRSSYLAVNHFDLFQKWRVVQREWIPLSRSNNLSYSCSSERRSCIAGGQNDSCSPINESSRPVRQLCQSSGRITLQRCRDLQTTLGLHAIGNQHVLCPLEAVSREY